MIMGERKTVILNPKDVLNSAFGESIVFVIEDNFNDAVELHKELKIE